MLGGGDGIVSCMLKWTSMNERRLEWWAGEMRKSKWKSFFAEKSFLFPFWQARSWQRKKRRESTNPNMTMTAKSPKRSTVPRKGLPPKSSAFRLHQHQQLWNQLPLPLPRTVPFQKSLADSMFTLHQCGLAMLWKVSLSSWTLFLWSKNRYISWQSKSKYHWPYKQICSSAGWHCSCTQWYRAHYWQGSNSQWFTILSLFHSCQVFGMEA